MLGAFVTTSELALVVLSAFLHAIWSASIKGSRNPLGFNLLQLVPPVTAACLLPLWVPLGDVPRAVWWIAIGTGISHGFYFYWLARALESGKLSVVYPIARSAPAFLPLFAVLLLGVPLMRSVPVFRLGTPPARAFEPIMPAAPTRPAGTEP